MSKMNVVEPRLQWFIGRMRRKLALEKNQAKGDWRELPYKENLDAIGDEFFELENAFLSPRPLNPIEPSRRRQEIIDECADVANRAMMLADQVHIRKEDK